MKTRSDDVISLVEDQIAAHGGEEFFEAIASEVLDRIDSDEPYKHTGRRLWLVYRQNPKVVDQVLIALTGWSMKSLLVFAEIIEDDEGLMS